MSAALKTAQVESGEIVFDSNLTVGQVRRMSSADGDVGTVIEVLSEIVRSWPFAGDPSDAEAWDNLTMSDFNSAALAITEELGKALAG